MSRRHLILAFLMIGLMVPSTHAEESSLQPSIENLAIPEYLGKIEARYPGNTDYWVIQIQDVHAHFAAQENIAAIIDHIHQVYGLKTVGIEGAWGETSFPESWGIPSSREKHTLARELLENDYLTGPAFAALFSEKPIQLIGVEEKETYDSNRELFLNHLKLRKESLIKIRAWYSDVQKKKKTLYSPELYQFDQELQNFRSGKKIEKFIPTIIPIARSKEVNFSDLDQLELFERILALERTLPKEKLNSEAGRLMKQFRNKTKLNFEELLRSGTITQEKMRYYPATQIYSKLLMLQDELDYARFFYQVEEIISRIKETHFTSEEIQQTDLASERQRLAEKIILLQATPDEVERVNSTQDLVSQDAARYELQEALQLGLDFYEIAISRDMIFSNKLKRETRFHKNMALVAGGFHTEGISQELQKSGISHMIITPNLEGGEMDEDLYFKRMLENPTEAETLQIPLHASFMHPEFDAAFVNGIRVLSETRNVIKARQAVMNFSQQSEQGLAQTLFDQEAFLSMSSDEQRNLVESWHVQVKDGKLPIHLIVKTSDLKTILETELGIAYWENFLAPRRTITVGEIQDTGEYLDALIGARLRVKRLAFDMTYDNALRKVFAKALESKTVAVISQDFQTAGVPVLRVHPASLLLFSMILESGVDSSQLTDEFFATVESILRDILASEGLVRASA